MFEIDYNNCSYEICSVFDQFVYVAGTDHSKSVIQYGEPVRKRRRKAVPQRSTLHKSSKSNPSQA